MLSVNENNTYFLKDSKPFFWLGDTAWLMFQKLSLLECEKYFINRKEKNFNLIQAVLVHDKNFEIPDVNVIKGDDFSSLDKTHKYWDKVDSCIKKAAEYGLYMGLLPVWGSMVKKGYLTLDNAKDYARFLADRYGKHKNIVWILGGDVRGSVGYDIWCLMGDTLKELCPDTLISFHPFGRTSSAMWFCGCKWLDFNMFQSGHRRYDQSTLGQWDDNSGGEEFFAEDNWKYVRRDLALIPKKPILDGEPSYEHIPQGLHDPSQPLWQAKDVRRYAYQSVFEGACGHTYGNNSVMQFFDKSEILGSYGATVDWREELDAPGAFHMKHLYTLINEFDFSCGVHNEKIVDNAGYEKYDRVTAFSGNDFALIYNYTGREFGINPQALDFEIKDVMWFDPTTGEKTKADIKNYASIIPPKNSNCDTDMVLVICG